MKERRKVLELFDRQGEDFDKKMAENIEKYRKGDVEIAVVDANGCPVPNVCVQAVQKTHAFRFGANLFLLDELETEAKNEAYKERFADVFNMATLPFYWDALEPEKGKPRYGKDTPKVYRRPSPDLCLEFCEKHGIEPREHALAYEAFFPKWLYGASVADVKRELERRYAEIAERYADKIRTIEVTNEMVWPEGKTSFYDAPDYVEWCFRLAEKYFPNNQLAINEATNASWQEPCRTSAMYYAYTEATMLRGARIDAIGMQYHLFHKREEEYENTRRLLDPENLYKHMDMYARFGKPLQITEVTVPAYSWEPEDEAMQAEIIEKLYTLWFSHPKVEQIIYWNLVDGYAHLWDPSPEKIKASQGDMTIGENYYYGGLLRFDLSPKPAYFKMKELVQEKWHTEETLTTNQNGKCLLRGFYGQYDLLIEAGGKKVQRHIEISKGKDKQIQVTL